MYTCIRVIHYYYLNAYISRCCFVQIVHPVVYEFEGIQSGAFYVMPASASQEEFDKCPEV